MSQKGNDRLVLYGEELSRQELLSRVGDISQVADIRLFEFTNGNERGVRAAEFYTGSGFTFTVLFDRGMDIDDARYKGLPVSWQSQTGPVAPAFYESKGAELVRQFQGGLLFGCGPTYVGLPSVDEGVELGLHGRLSNIPAKDVCVRKEWKGADYVMSVEGHMDEVGTGLDSLRVSRRIEARLGESRLRMREVVENIGFARSPFCLLYHVNIGWPIVSKNSRLHIKSKVQGWTHTPVEMDKWEAFQEPTQGYLEQLFYHTPEADGDGMANAAVINPAFGGGQGYGVYLRWTRETLPYMVQWKLMGQKAYVLGMEPSNATSDGRAAVRKAGLLKFLDPEETAELEMEIGILDGQAEIAQWLKRNGLG